jgi:hypothetical protein
VLPLDAVEWVKLEHAYGPASDVPQLLEQLAQNPRPKSNYRAEPWFTLWSSLCHQDDVYSASYAALPHIVRICLAAEGPVDFSFFQLPACIEVARASGRGPRLTADLSEAYFDGLRLLHDCAFKHAANDWDQCMALCVAAALAAAKGQVKAADAILNLDNEMIARITSRNW